jgi:hypothetical protein
MIGPFDSLPDFTPWPEVRSRLCKGTLFDRHDIAWLISHFEYLMDYHAICTTFDEEWAQIYCKLDRSAEDVFEDCEDLEAESNNTEKR